MFGNRQRKEKSWSLESAKIEMTSLEESFQVSVISTMIFFIWKVNSLKTYQS